MMEKKQINIIELWNIVDNWHDNNLSIKVKVITKNGKALQGVATTGRYIPEKIKEARPSHIYIDNTHTVLLSDIESIEFDNCCYTITNHEYDSL